MKDIQDAISQLVNFSPELLTVVVVIALGYVLRFVPYIKKNKQYIPPLCMLLGTIGYTVVVKPPVIEGIRAPHVRMAMIGFILSFVAWLCHNKFLKKLEDKWGLFTDTGDTTTFTKNETKPAPFVEPPPAP